MILLSNKTNFVLFIENNLSSKIVVLFKTKFFKLEKQSVSIFSICHNCSILILNIFALCDETFAVA